MQEVQVEGIVSIPLRKFRKEERADGFPSAPMSFHPSKEV